MFVPIVSFVMQYNCTRVAVSFIHIDNSFDVESRCIVIMYYKPMPRRPILLNVFNEFIKWNDNIAIY